MIAQKSFLPTPSRLFVPFVFLLPPMYIVTLSGEPDDVYDKGEGNGQGVASEKA